MQHPIRPGSLTRACHPWWRQRMGLKSGQGTLGGWNRVFVLAFDSPKSRWIFEWYWLMVRVEGNMHWILNIHPNSWVNDAPFCFGLNIAVLKQTWATGAMAASVGWVVGKCWEVPSTECGTLIILDSPGAQSRFGEWQEGIQDDTRIQCHSAIPSSSHTRNSSKRGGGGGGGGGGIFNALKPEEMLTEELRKKLEDLPLMHGWGSRLCIVASSATIGYPLPQDSFPTGLKCQRWSTYFPTRHSLVKASNCIR